MTTTSTCPVSSSRAPETPAALELILGPAAVRWTGRAEGDLGVTANGDVDARRRTVEPRPWAWLHQVHGTTVHVVDRPGAVQGADGDALVSGEPDVVLAVFTADCAPVAMVSDEGVVGLAHGGWHGLRAGIIEATVSSMRRLGATSIRAALGPCIRPECYEFSPADLDTVVNRYGSDVRGTTTSGAPALDMPALVAAALDTAGASLVADASTCTGCAPGWFSHRARRDPERQATLVVRT